MIWPPAKSSAGFKAGWSLDRGALGGRSIIGDARNPQMQSVMNLKYQIPGVFPALRSHRAARAGVRLFRNGYEQPLYASGCAGAGKARRHADDGKTKDPMGHRSAQCSAVGHPGGHPCRLLGTRPDRRTVQDESTVLQVAQSLRSENRLRPDRQYLVQRA